MTMYALTKDDVTISRLDDFPSRPPDPLGKGWRWLPYELVSPPFDPATEVREGPVDTVDIPGDVARRVWTVRPMTQAEMDASLEDRSQLASNDPEIMRAAFTGCVAFSNAILEGCRQMVNIERAARGAQPLTQAQVKSQLDPTAEIVTYEEWRAYVKRNLSGGS